MASDHAANEVRALRACSFTIAAVEPESRGSGRFGLSVSARLAVHRQPSPQPVSAPRSSNPASQHLLAVLLLTLAAARGLPWLKGQHSECSQWPVCTIRQAGDEKLPYSG